MGVPLKRAKPPVISSRTVNSPAATTLPMASSEIGRYTSGCSAVTGGASGVVGAGGCVSMVSSVPKQVFLAPRAGEGLIVAAAGVGNVGQHGPAGGLAQGRVPALVGALRLQVNFVLEDLLDDDGQLVAALDLDQRPGPGVQRHHALLDQRGQLEPAAHLVDNRFFFQVVVHRSLLLQPW